MQKYILLFLITVSEMIKTEKAISSKSSRESYLSLHMKQKIFLFGFHIASYWFNNLGSFIWADNSKQRYERCIQNNQFQSRIPSKLLRWIKPFN